VQRLVIYQLSDLHLGASLAGGRLALPTKKAEDRRREHRHAFERFAAKVHDDRPNAVLLPGDLFDSGEPSVDDLNFLIAAVNTMAPVPVFLTPGNHDGYGPSSCYNVQSALYQSRGGAPKWGGHVHIFTGEGFERRPLPQQADVTVTGAAYHRHVPETRRVLADVEPAPDQGLHLLLFHGALKNYPRPGADADVLPFTSAELGSLGFAYAAVGHYHHGGPIADGEGRLLGAYAGAPFATSLADEGCGTWLQIDVHPGRPVAQDDLTWHRLDERRIRTVEMDVTGLTDTLALEERLNERLEAEGVGKRDILRVALKGRLARGIVFRPQDILAERFHHAVVDDSAVEPDYDIDFDHKLPPEPGLAATGEQVLRWKMLHRYKEAATDAERRRIKHALFYGLDALASDEIHLR
jgi:DNA repair exonuclease SbcCD nuclease subunit